MSRYLRFFSIVGFFSLLITFCKSNQKQKSEIPNIVFVLVDDLGWKDLGVYSSEFYETENLDKFASENVMFTNAYSACPVSSPSRASIMTGKYPSRVNITDWIPGLDPKDKKLLGPDDGNELSLDEITIAEALKQNGYKTFFAGKWHLGDKGFFPEDQGFDINIGGHHMGQPPGGYYSPYNIPKLKDVPDGEYLTNRLTDETINFIDANQDKPFFAFLSFYSVHTPIEANKDYVDHFKEKLSQLESKDVIKKDEHNGATVQNQVNADYASMVYSVDQNFGRLIAKLKELKLYENTIIIFTSDNGGLTTLPPNSNAPTSVIPLRAGKGWCYEGGIRVPLIIKSLENSQGIKCDYPVIGTDFYPTILELAGLDLMPSQHLDGKSLVPLLKGKSQIEREAIFWHYPHYHGSTWTPGAAIRKGNWKYIEFYDYGTSELFNLSTDIGENFDLSSQYPEKVEELKSLLKKMQYETNCKFPTRNSNFVNKG